MRLRPGSNAPTTSGGALSALTRSVLAHKRLVALLWATIALAGLVAAGRASDALDTDFAIFSTQIGAARC